MSPMLTNGKRKYAARRVDEVGAQAIDAPMPTAAPSTAAITGTGIALHRPSEVRAARDDGGRPSSEMALAPPPELAAMSVISAPVESCRRRR